MSGSLVLRSGVGTQMLMVSSSRDRREIGGGAQLARFHQGLEDARWGCPGCRTRRALTASTLAACRSMPVTVETRLGELHRQRQADIAQARRLPSLRLAARNLLCKAAVRDSQVEFTFRQLFPPAHEPGVRTFPTHVERAGRRQRPVPGSSTRPRTMAATAAPVEPVPELMVSPQPRSKNCTSIVCSSTGTTNDTLVRFGKSGCVSISAPTSRQSKSKLLHEHRALRIPYVEDRRIQPSRCIRRVRARAVSRRGLPMFISNRNALPWRSISRRSSTPAPVPMRIVVAAPSRSAIRNAAAQRVPLPDISGSLPSELNSRIAVACRLRSGARPAASRRLRRRCAGRRSRERHSAVGSAGASSAQVSRKSFFAPWALVKGISSCSAVDLEWPARPLTAIVVTRS